MGAALGVLALVGEGLAGQEPTDSFLPRPGGSASCIVERVIDGDTFACVGGERVRLLVIDTPELAQRPFGSAAREEAVRLLPVGGRVRLDFDVEVPGPVREAAGLCLAAPLRKDRPTRS